MIEHRPLQERIAGILRDLIKPTTVIGPGSVDLRTIRRGLLSRLLNLLFKASGYSLLFGRNSIGLPRTDSVRRMTHFFVGLLNWTKMNRKVRAGFPKPS